MEEPGQRGGERHTDVVKYRVARRRRWRSKSYSWLCAVACSVGSVRLRKEISRRPRMDLAGQLNVGGASALAYSPDGNYLAVATGDVVKLFRTDGYEMVHELGGRGSHVLCLAFSPDVMTLVSGSEDHSADLWSVASGEHLHLFADAQDAVRCVAFSPDGETIAAAFGGSVHLWNVPTGRLLCTLRGDQGTSLAACFSPDGLALATGGTSTTIDLWNVAAEEVQSTLSARAAVVSMAYFRDGRTLVSGSRDGAVTLWDVETSTAFRTVERHPGSVQSIALSPDDKRLAVGFTDGAIELWDLAEFDLLTTIAGYPQYVSCLAFSPDGEMLASGSSDGVVLIWGIPNRSWVNATCATCQPLASVPMRHP